jgi:hypothetical protein
MNIPKPTPDMGPVEKPKVHRVLPQTPEPAPEETKPEIKEDAPPEPEWPLKVKLKKSIKIIDKAKDIVVQEVDVMEFREPTAQDIIACGVPVIVENYRNGQVAFDSEKMALMMARLSKLPIMYIQAMDPIDWINCATMLQRNFLPDWDRML